MGHGYIGIEHPVGGIQKQKVRGWIEDCAGDDISEEEIAARSIESEEDREGFEAYKRDRDQEGALRSPDGRFRKQAGSTIRHG